MSETKVHQRSTAGQSPVKTGKQMGFWIMKRKDSINRHFFIHSVRFMKPATLFAEEAKIAHKEVFQTDVFQVTLYSHTACSSVTVTHQHRNDSSELRLITSGDLADSHMYTTVTLCRKGTKKVTRTRNIFTSR